MNDQKPPSGGFFIVSPAATCNLWVADPRQVAFLCLPKEKRPKERAPRSARPLPPFLAPPGARQLAGRKIRASGSNAGSLKSSRWGCGTRRALRGPENLNAWRCAFFQPRMAHPSPARLWASARRGADTGMSAPAPPRQDVASGQRRDPKPRRRGGFCTIRGVLSLVSFFA